MNGNGQHKSGRHKGPVTEAALQSAHLQLLEDGYAGKASFSPRYISGEDYIILARQVALDLDLKIDTHLDRETGVSAVRLNSGLPIGILFGSHYHRDFLAKNPGFVKENAALHNLFYGLHIVGD